LAVIVIAVVLLRGGGGYTVTAEFLNGGQLVPGNPVQVAGADVGTVENLRISDDGTALVRFSVDDECAALALRRPEVPPPATRTGATRAGTDRRQPGGQFPS
jgi:paraquat-inducible protein B